MKHVTNYQVVLVTAPNLKTAREVVKAAFDARLIACANLIPKMESHYLWKGQVKSAEEVLIILKSSGDCIDLLRRLVVEKHPYDMPEFLVLPIAGGHLPFLDWISESTTPA